MTKRAGKKVLFISQHYPPDLTADAFRISETARWLTRFGFEVGVLTARPHRDQAESESIPDEDNNIRVIRTPIISIGERGGVWHMLQFLSFVVTAFLWGLFRIPRQVDHVVATSPPLFVAIPGWLLARLRRARFVLDVRDLWPDSALAIGQLPVPRVSLPMGKGLEHFMYRRADLIVCVSTMMRDEILRRVSGRKTVEVIYNAAELSTPVPPQQPAEPEEGPHLKTIVYAGNIGRSQGLEVVVKAAHSFPNIRFRFVGGGVMKRPLQGMASSLGLDNVEFVGPTDKQTALKQLSEASALVLHLRNEAVFATTIPSKLFDYLRVNKPIIYGVKGEGAELLATNPGNIGFTPEDVESLTRAIECLKSEYDTYRKGAQGNSALLRDFSREKMAHKLASLLHVPEEEG